jgi:hypothetical protein
MVRTFCFGTLDTDALPVLDPSIACWILCWSVLLHGGESLDRR